MLNERESRGYQNSSESSPRDHGHSGRESERERGQQRYRSEMMLRIPSK